nr:hypothetical protein [Paracoccus sp. NBH48]
MMSPICSRFDDVIQDVDGLPTLGLGRVAGQARQIVLDLLLSPVDLILNRADLGQGGGIVLAERRAGLGQHPLDAVADVQNLAPGAGQGQGRRVQNLRIQPARRGRGRMRVLRHQHRHQTADQPVEGPDQRRQR